ncbi:MAG: TrkH family potassium uptake protein [Leptonema sp. (in: bacteria)]
MEIGSQSKNINPIGIKSVYYKVSFYYTNYVYKLFRILFFFVSFISIVLLFIEYGIYYPVEWTKVLRRIIQIVIYYFLFYEFVNLLFLRTDIINHLSNYWRYRKIEILIAILVSLILAVEGFLIPYLILWEPSVDKLVLIYLSISQVLLLINNFFHFSRNISNLSYKRFNPSLVFLGSYILVIFLGFILLSLPKMHTKQLSYIDILFLVTSAVCVTGLTPIDVGKDLSFSGQLVLLFLIQLGGLGLMTLTSFFSFYFSGRISLTNQIMMKELFSEYSLEKVKGILKQIAIFTFTIEILGVIYLYLTLPDSLIPQKGSKLFYSIFHSISAFCNAGFSLFSDSLYTLSQIQPFSIYGIMFLVMFGGIGFPVIQDIINKISIKNHKFSLTTKIVLASNLILWIVGFFVFIFFNFYYHYNFKISELILHAFVFTVTPRTAGFNTIPYDTLNLPLIFFTFLLMWIGTSPISTGGGIKTTTITISIFHVLSLIRGHNRVEITKKEIGKETIIRAYSNVLLSLMTIFAGIFLLSIFEKKPDFLKITFEVVSAYGTVGLTLGITNGLEPISKVVLCFVMLTGRVGILTFLLAIIPKSKELHYEYPKEYVVVG